MTSALAAVSLTALNVRKVATIFYRGNGEAPRWNPSELETLKSCVLPVMRGGRSAFIAGRSRHVSRPLFRMRVIARI